MLSLWSVDFCKDCWKWKLYVAWRELCFIAFPIMPLIESFNNAQKLLGETHLFLKCGDVKYFIDMFDFLKKGNLLTILSSLLSLLPSTPASSGRFLTLTSFWLIWLWSLFCFQAQHPQPRPLTIASSQLIGLGLFWASKWDVWLIYQSPGWNVNRNRRNCLNSLVFHLSPFFNALKTYASSKIGFQSLKDT